MARRVASWLKPLIRVVITIAFVVVLLRKRPDLSQIVPHDGAARAWAFAAAAVAVTAIGIGLAAWRWQRVLMVFGRPMPIRRLAVHGLVGHCVSNVLPGTIGGDAVRIARLSGDINNREIAFASVALERLAGFVALPLLVVLGFTLDPKLLAVSGAWIAIVIATATLGILAVLVIIAGHERLAGRFTNHDNWLRFFGALHYGVNQLRRHPMQIVAVVATSLIYQVSVVTAVGLLAIGLGVHVPSAAIVAFVPAVAMVQVLPISVNGLGVREGMLSRFLAPLGVATGQAIGLGLFWYATVLIVSLAGVPPIAAGRRSTARYSSG